MIKKGFRFFLSLNKFEAIKVPQTLRIHWSNQRWVSWKTSGSSAPVPKQGKMPVIINAQLMRSDKIQDLLFVHSKFKQYMNLINFSVLLKSLNEKNKTNNNQLFTENYFNEIVNGVILKIEREGIEDPRTLASLYNYINRFPFTNQYKTRVNFLLEQKGMMMFKEMKHEELSSYAHTLAKLGKKTYFQGILMYISSQMKQYNIRMISTILYDSCILDLKTPEVAAEFQNYILSQKENIRFSSQDFSFIFYYCGKNSDVMNNPEFFQKLENLAKLQVNYSNGIALSNIFHGLSFYDKQMMSSKFYEIFESRILYLLSELSHQALSLILRGYSIFGQGSEFFYGKIIEEAHKRVRELDPEAFTTIFYMLTKSKKISFELIESFTYHLLGGKLSQLLPKQFEHIFYSYFNLLKDDVYKPNKKLMEAFSQYINQHIDNFSIQRLGNIAHMCTLLLKEDQNDLSIKIQNLIINTQSIDIDSVELKSICEIAYFVLYETADKVLDGFVTKIIDLSLPLAQKKLIDKEELTKLHFLRYYGKLLIVLTPQDKLTADDLVKRKNLFELIEQWLIKAYEESPGVPEDFEVESLLMNFIIGFYNVLKNPLDETKHIFKEALKAANYAEFKAENTNFLMEKTDLIEKTFIKRKPSVESPSTV